MGDRRERCNGCGIELIVPGKAKAIRCAVCGAVTKVQNQRIQAHEKVQQAAELIKGLTKAIFYGMTSNNINGNDGGGSATATSSPPSHLYGCNNDYFRQNTMYRPPSFPSAHGKKRALLCGVSYRTRRYELQGSVNDVNCIKYLLTAKFGFSNDSILVLTEDERDPYRIPTKQNMRMAMHWLVYDCQPGDSLVFHYSGHGSQQPDYMGHEVDGSDETLCPLDYETEGMIVDNEINETIVRPLPRGVKLHAIIDACHSGTVLDLPFLCRMNRVGVYHWEDHSPPSGAYKGTSGGLAISFSGCDDNQTSADTSALSGGAMTGAMTFSFIKAVESEAGMTYGRLLTAMRTAIREANTGIRISGPIASLINRVFCTGLTQEPQLSSSESFDIYRKSFLI